MKKHIYYAALTLVFTSAFLFQCKKEKDIENQEQEVFFAIATPDAKNGSDTKGDSGYNLIDARKIVLTIKNADDSPTKYSSSELKIYQMNGAFFSQKLILKTGAYRLTEFLIMDSTENVIFTSPLKGANEAQNVIYPLPIAFEILKNVSTPVNVEVISTENKSPEDFGLVSFQISEANVFDFLITVADKKNAGFLTSKLTITSGTYSYVQMLDSIAGNRITVKDSIGINSYNLTIEKYGYLTYSHNYPKDSLKLFNSSGNNTPLLIDLEIKPDIGTVTDIENNIYKTVKIGDQWWMAENLKTTKYNDGTEIPLVTDFTIWRALTTGAYTDYAGTPSNSTSYGRLYNWYTVDNNAATMVASNGGKNVCPAGWHIPSNDEWITLTTYLGGAVVAGGKLK